MKNCYTYKIFSFILNYMLYNLYIIFIFERYFNIYKYNISKWSPYYITKIVWNIYYTQINFIIKFILVKKRKTISAEKKRKDNEKSKTLMYE